MAKEQELMRMRQAISELRQLHDGEPFAPWARTSFMLAPEAAHDPAAAARSRQPSGEDSSVAVNAPAATVRLTRPSSIRPSIDDVRQSINNGQPSSMRIHTRLRAASASRELPQEDRARALQKVREERIARGSTLVTILYGGTRIVDGSLSHEYLDAIHTADGFSCSFVPEESEPDDFLPPHQSEPGSIFAPRPATAPDLAMASIASASMPNLCSVAHAPTRPVTALASYWSTPSPSHANAPSGLPTSVSTSSSKKRVPLAFAASSFRANGQGWRGMDIVPFEVPTREMVIHGIGTPAALKRGATRRKRQVSVSMQAALKKVQSDESGMPLLPTPHKQMTKVQLEQQGRMRTAWRLYNSRQTARGNHASRVGAMIDRQTTSAPQLQLAYDHAYFNVSSSRFVASEPPMILLRRRATASPKKPKEPPKAAPKPAEPSRQQKFIWQPRAAFADSKDIFDTDEVELKQFNVDWKQACELGLSKLIDKLDDDGGVDADGDGISDEVAETKAVMWDYHDRIVQLFDYYAAVGGSLSSLALNQWSAFVEDFELVVDGSKYCKKSDMDTLFIAVNARSVNYEKAKAKEQGKAVTLSAAKALNRVEFLYLLVEVAINRWVKPGAIRDISTAVRQLFAELIEPRVDKRIFRDYNDFRKLAYESTVNDVLCKYESSLRNAFSVASGTEFGHKNLLSLAQWSEFIRALGFIGVDVSERDVKLSFVMSRMAVIDARPTKGETKANHLPFEGFMEAICRLSMVKALPTDEELSKAKCSDGGMFLLMLAKKELDEEILDEFVDFKSTHAIDWGGEPMQPLARCVEHMVTSIIRTIIDEVSSASGSVVLHLSKNDAHAWAKVKLCED